MTQNNSNKKLLIVQGSLGEQNLAKRCILKKKKRPFFSEQMLLCASYSLCCPKPHVPLGQGGQLLIEIPASADVGFTLSIYFLSGFGVGGREVVTVHQSALICIKFFLRTAL